MKENSGKPSVSVLVAARNEEANLLACLKALEKQDYSGPWEVLVGNDHSEDQTLAIARQFSGNQSHFRVFDMPKPETSVKGKAFVLGKLAKESVGEILLMCDADMQMPAGWITAMVDTMQDLGVDMLNGTTTTEGKSLFSVLQGIDWLVPQAHFSWMTRLGLAYTAMGNNMAISRKAYEATGGYFEIPFSITEDFELFRQAQNRGFRLIHHFHHSVLGISAPQKTPKDWLQQHIRWMIGFFQLPFAQQWVLYVQLLFYPLIILAFILHFGLLFKTLMILWGIKFLSTAGYLVRLGKTGWLMALLLYELIWWPAYMACLLGYFFAENIEWKGRLWKKTVGGE